MSSNRAIASYLSGNAQLPPVHLIGVALQLPVGHPHRPHQCAAPPIAVLPAQNPMRIQRVAARKLEQLNAATVFETLRIPPSNRLEVLTGDRQGQHSIRVNDQWRVCFVWRDNNVFDVEIVDYH